MIKENGLGMMNENRMGKKSLHYQLNEMFKLVKKFHKTKAKRKSQEIRYKDIHSIY